MKNRITITYLILAGMLLVGIGSAILLTPHAFYASNDIALGYDPTLLSEVRAPGGLLASAGIILLIGAVRRQFRLQALLLSAFVYGSFGVARMVGVALDGMPSSSIVGAMALELIAALVALAIVKTGSRNGTPSPFGQRHRRLV